MIPTRGPARDLPWINWQSCAPVFVKGGTVTAGNSSSLNDGAAAVVVMSADKARELGVVPKLKVEGYAVAGFDAELMGYSPKFSSEKLAAKLGLDLKEIDMFEINEAFASQAFAVSRDLGLTAKGKHLRRRYLHRPSHRSHRMRSHC